ncbi:MAG: hypothetical protein HC941_21200 [Microcoleus sp. SU_5_3]|nr:hypothetical protein [Microcoleus sp. SU_5_3]
MSISLTRDAAPAVATGSKKSAMGNVGRVVTGTRRDAGQANERRLQVMQQSSHTKIQEALVTP